MTSEEHECSNSLWPDGINYESQKLQNPKRVPNTCLWTLQNPKYIEWRDTEKSNLLWVSADPGCGKSVLARSIIDEDLPGAFENVPSKHVLYYFFKDTSPEQRSATQAMVTILYQLFVYQPRLIKYALPSYRELGKALSTSFPRLWSILIEALADPLAVNTFCVLDALDECSESEQSLLIEALNDVCVPAKSPSSAPQPRFLVTSRPYFDIRRGFDRSLDKCNLIELSGNDESESIRKEIDLVIKHRVAKLKQENYLVTRVTNHLEKKLLGAENRTYLWLKLIWIIVEKSLVGTVSEMDVLVENLPSNVQEAYETLLQKCPNQPFAKRVFEIVSVAYRPLTLDEIDFALSVREDSLTDTDFELEGTSRLQKTLSSRCGLMITIIQSKVYFIHHTVKDFLLRGIDPQSAYGTVWKHCIERNQAHYLMANICLKSFVSPNFQWDRANLYNALLPAEGRAMGMNAYCQTYHFRGPMRSFLPYSAIYWADHYTAQKTWNITEMDEKLLTHRETIVFDQYGNEWGTLILPAAGGGHKGIVQMLLEGGSDVNEHQKDTILETVLQASSCFGCTEIVQMLLERGAEVNEDPLSPSGCTPLEWASAKGRSETVELLLQWGAEVNKLNRDETALQLASRHGHSEVVRALLQWGAEMNTTNSNYPPLHVASQRGHSEIVRTLLEWGARINTTHCYITALDMAHIAGQWETVLLLRDKGAVYS